MGVYIRLTNVSTKTYDDSPLNGSRLVTDIPNAGVPTILQSGRCQSKTLGIGLKLMAGTSRTGCLPFQVKRKAKVSGFRFTLDSGQGPETAGCADTARAPDRQVGALTPPGPEAPRASG